MMRFYLDVGSRWGEHYLAYAREFPNTHGIIFEPNPEYYEILVETFRDNPYVTLLPYAVSDESGPVVFNISATEGCSSLLDFADNLGQSWPGRDGFEVTKRVEVRGVTLAEMIDEYGVDQIDYLHVDAQGVDLRVLKSLGQYIGRVVEGDVEVAAKTDVELYKGADTTIEALDFLIGNGFSIRHVIPNDPNNGGQGNEQNIGFFKNGAPREYFDGAVRLVRNGLAFWDDFSVIGFRMMGVRARVRPAADGTYIDVTADFVHASKPLYLAELSVAVDGHGFLLMEFPSGWRSSYKDFTATIGPIPFDAPQRIAIVMKGMGL